MTSEIGDKLDKVTTDLAGLQQSTKKLEQAILKVKAMGISSFILCGDFQVELPPFIEGVTGPCRVQFPPATWQQT